MITFPSLLANAASKSGIMVPQIVDNYSREDYPHWFVFCWAQLGRPMPSPVSHWNNAKLIAGIPANQLKYVSIEDLNKKGLQ